MHTHPPNPNYTPYNPLRSKTICPKSRDRQIKLPGGLVCTERSLSHAGKILIRSSCVYSHTIQVRGCIDPVTCPRYVPPHGESQRRETTPQNHQASVNFCPPIIPLETARPCLSVIPSELSATTASRLQAAQASKHQIPYFRRRRPGGKNTCRMERLAYSFFLTLVRWFCLAKILAMENLRLSDWSRKVGSVLAEKGTQQKQMFRPGPRASRLSEV